MHDIKSRTWMIQLRSAARLGLATTILAGSLAAQEAAVVAHNAWARPPAASRNMTGMFVVLENHSGQKRSVVGGSSNVAEKVELHEMKNEGGMMRMSPVSQIDIPANGKTELKPGGLHIMLFGLKGKYVEGDTFTVTLKLDNDETVLVKATFRQPPAQ
jgi:periplasmic copper chaperone A